MKPLPLVLLLLSGLIAIIYVFASGTTLVGGDNAKLPEVVDYNFHVKSILSDNCYTCHGPDAAQRKAGLRLDVESEAYAELPENPGKFALVAGKPLESELYLRIVAEDEAIVMPPPESNLSLTEREKAIIKKWIEQGGAFARHWAYIPPEKSPLPTVEEIEWGNNEIDAFVLARMAEAGLTPSPPAPSATLLRRISLDVTGLPPAPSLVDRFTGEPTAEALGEFVDSLFATPAYGERMAQSWLDVARYADSHGYQDDSYRTMWPWRDWVIHAFNSNLPYDEFITWQLAGDLLPDATPEQILATGFNRNHPITQEGGVIQEEYRTNYVVDRTNTLGKGLLGLTLECSKCHDHKYDAISQREYYATYAFFNQVDEQGLRMDAVQAANQKYYADAPFMTLKDGEIDEILAFINKPPGDSVNVMIMNDDAPKETYVLNRGNYDAPTDIVEPGVPAAIYPFDPEWPKNRLGLSKWLTAPDHPLTARVFVNRIWGMLFGRGLVETVEDFGVQGSLPSHPDLLDWLARDFVEHDWDIQYLLKKIILSATYQQQSALRPELENKDPENRWLARASRFRMSGEMIRDYVLATSGLLNEEVGGPSVKPYQPPGLWEETNAGGNRGILTSYVPDEGDKLYRRSLYTFWKRTLPPPSMMIFDAPNRDVCEVRRQKTNTPLQALALQNDVQMVEAARVLAQKTVANGGPQAERPATVFKRILVRDPRPEEVSLINNYYADAYARYTADTVAADSLIRQGNYPLAPSDPAETAALMLTAQLVYNLDETITKE